MADYTPATPQVRAASEAHNVATVNIASKRLNEMLVESWAVPVLKFLTDVGHNMKSGGRK